jgi:hypothetical protein
VSEPVPESAPTRSGGSVFTRRLGVLPLWAWMGIGLAVALGYYYWRQSMGGGAAAKSQAASAGQAAGGIDSNLVPQFVNQTFVQDSPPQPTMPATPTTAPTQAGKYPAPSNTKVSKLTSTSAKINWDYITGTSPKPSSYTIAVYQLNGKLAQQFTVNAPDTAGGTAQATVAGLHPGWKYNVHVWANGGKVAPPHSSAQLAL